MIKYTVEVELLADSEANFWEIDRRNNEAILAELVEDLLYDIDDVRVIKVTAREDT